MRTPDDKRTYRRPSARRILSEEEQRLWQLAMADVRPIAAEQRRGPAPADAASDTPGPAAGRAPGAAEDPPPRAGSDPLPARSRVAASRSAPVRMVPGRVVPAPAELAPGAASGIDIRTLTRLKRGLIPPQSQIDLHQCTQAEAHRLLQSFLVASQARGRRCVLVITGKGYGSGGAVGVLKTMVPRWLNEPPVRSLVIAFAHAIPAHGGEGALYVLLRRLRRDG